jgi:LAS superfamily LD-carboxypeptidase LdcB
MSTPVPPAPTPTPAPSFTDVADDLGAFEQQFKDDYSGLSASAQKLFDNAVAAAKAEGSVIFGAFHSVAQSTKK